MPLIFAAGPSYHNGSVCPRQCTLIVTGQLMRYGFVKEAQRLASALMETGRIHRPQAAGTMLRVQHSDNPEPLPYPTACSAPLHRRSRHCPGLQGLPSGSDLSSPLATT
jgi:hypothetical protein